MATHEQTTTLVRNGHAYCRLRPFLREFPNQERELLLENRIWFSDISRQDDIFEGRPLFRWENAEVTRADLLAMSHRQAPHLSRVEREQLVAHMYARHQDHIERQIMQAWVEVDTEAMYASSSICCFFRNPCEPRFWTEYADRHRGYALLFDFSAAWRMQTFRGHGPINIVPMPVQYVDVLHRPTVTLSLGVRGGEDAFTELEKALLTKSAEWSNQGEFRIVRVGMGAGHVEFPAESLVGVVLGHHIADADRRTLTELRAERELPLPLYEARPSRTLYGMDLRPID